jgi:apolipoprotein D and lipocalin family protein
MQFIWPIKADYRIMYLTDNYSQTIIARNKRDYVWIMARTPTIPESDYEHMLKLIENVGYDISQIQRVPQQWSDTAIQQNKDK